MESSHNAIISQPAAVSYDQIDIRPMERADSEFASSMIVEAFRPKMEHAVGKDKIDVLINGMNLEMSTRPIGGYDDIFIAWLSGERAGFMKLKHHGSRNVTGDESYPGLGLCCAGIRLGVFESLANESVKEGVCYLDILAVDGKFRGRGIGKALLMKADQEAMRRGCKMIFLNVVDGNRAIHLYEREGYKITSSDDSCCLNFATGYSRLHQMEKRLP